MLQVVAKALDDYSEFVENVLRKLPRHFCHSLKYFAARGEGLYPSAYGIADGQFTSRFSCKTKVFYNQNEY